MSDTKLSVNPEQPPMTMVVHDKAIPQFLPNDPRSRLVSVEGRPGKYQFRAVLGEPGRNEVLEALDFEKLLLSGDSPIVVPRSTHEVRVQLVGESEAAQILFAVNAQGRLASAKIELSAKSFDDAYSTGYDLLSLQL